MFSLQKDVDIKDRDDVDCDCFIFGLIFFLTKEVCLDFLSFWRVRLSVAIQVLSWSIKSWIFSFDDVRGGIIDFIWENFSDDEGWCDRQGITEGESIVSKSICKSYC